MLFYKQKAQSCDWAFALRSAASLAASQQLKHQDWPHVTRFLR